MARYTEENIEKTLMTIDKLIELDKKKTEKIIEMQVQLIRIGRAIKPKFWLEDWKRIPQKQKVEIINKEKCVKIMSYNMTEKIRDFPFIAKVQWEKDRKKLIKEGAIKP